MEKIMTKGEEMFLELMATPAAETLTFTHAPGYINLDFEIQCLSGTWLLKVDSPAASAACEVMGLPLMGNYAGEFSSLAEIRGIIRELAEIDTNIGTCLRSGQYSKDKWYSFDLGVAIGDKWYTTFAENHPLFASEFWDEVGIYTTTRAMAPRLLEDRVDQLVYDVVGCEEPLTYERPAYAR
jgi:hypothetical protein